MKEFKLKTLAAVCLFTVSAYGMEESPESSSKASDTYLYVVPDEDLTVPDEDLTVPDEYLTVPDEYLTEERSTYNRIETIIHTRDSIVECIEDITESEYLDLDEALEFVQSINERIWRSMMSKFPVKEETIKEKRKYWLSRLRHECKESLQQVFPDYEDLEYKTYLQLVGRY